MEEAAGNLTGSSKARRTSGAKSRASASEVFYCFATRLAHSNVVDPQRLGQKNMGASKAASAAGKAHIMTK
jgi:hypothetical protein